MNYENEYDNEELLKLIMQDKKIKSIDEYEKIEENLYKKYNIKNGVSKIKFECQRIIRYIIKNSIDDKELLEALIKFLTVISKDNIHINEKIQKEILIDLAKIEIKLGMKCVLYNEITEYVKEIAINYKKIYNDEINKDKKIYNDELINNEEIFNNEIDNLYNNKENNKIMNNYNNIEGKKLR